LVNVFSWRLVATEKDRSCFAYKRQQIAVGGAS
jgi:hypothetical protein